MNAISLSLPWLPALAALLALGAAIRRIWFWQVRAAPFHKPGQLLCLAHRGILSRAPENTLPAFEETIKAGVDGIELDVMETADGVVVVRHDFDLEHTTDGTGYVWERPYEYLAGLNAAAAWGGSYPRTPLPTLEEALALIPSDMLVNIELKAHRWRSAGLEEKVVALVRECRRVQHTIISSFNPYWLMQVRRLEPQLRLGFLWRDVDMPWYLRRPVFLNLVQPDFLHPSLRVVTPAVVERAHRRGMKVNVWTVNNRPMIKHLKAMGVDGVFTDFPELVQQVNRG